MASELERNVMSKLRRLPLDRQRQVLDFVEAQSLPRTHGRRHRRLPRRPEIRVVSDTNVLVSAILRNREPEAIMAEYREVPARPKFALPAPILASWLRVLEERVAVVKDAKLRLWQAPFGLAWLENFGWMNPHYERPAEQSRPTVIEYSSRDAGTAP